MINSLRRMLASGLLPVVSAAVCFVGSGGCAQFNNPFRDPYASNATYTTASVEGFRATPGKPHATRRFETDIVVPAEPVVVTHGPLYFDDPCEERGSENGEFRWGADDYLFFATWRLRFLGNVAALPVNLVITPPWRVMESDGELSPNWFGERHDATVSPCQCWRSRTSSCRDSNAAPAASHGAESQAG